jgi:hypothetical protein
VELTLNGKSLGKGTPCSDEYPALQHPPLIWKNIKYRKGILEARGKYGEKRLIDSRTSSGNPAIIMLSASNDIIPDGRDISFIDIMICDKNGNRCYLASGKISLTVTGAARLAGDGQVEVSGGLARVAIRSNGAIGEIRLIAEGEQLKKGEIFLKARIQ